MSTYVGISTNKIVPVPAVPEPNSPEGGRGHSRITYGIVLVREVSFRLLQLALLNGPRTDQQGFCDYVGYSYRLPHY